MCEDECVRTITWNLLSIRSTWAKVHRAVCLVLGGAAPISLASLTACGGNVAATPNGFADSTREGEEAAPETGDGDGMGWDVSIADSGAARVDSSDGCSATIAFPTFDKTCVVADDCEIAFHSRCCGMSDAIGITKGQSAAFKAAEELWNACDPEHCSLRDCPPCGCYRAEDGTTSPKAAAAIGVACTSGKCTTFVKPGG